MPRLTIRDTKGKLRIGLLEIQVSWGNTVLKLYVDRRRLLCYNKLRYVLLRIFTFLLVCGQFLRPTAIRSAVWGQFLRQTAYLYHSLRTVLEAKCTSVPQFEDSSWGQQPSVLQSEDSFEANSLSVPQSEDRSGGKVHICTAVWGQFLKQAAQVYRSLRTLLEARNTVVPMAERYAGSSIHLVRNYEKELGLRAQNSVLLLPARLYNIFPHYLTSCIILEKMLRSIKKCVLISSTTFSWNISHSKKTLYL